MTCSFTSCLTIRPRYPTAWDGEAIAKFYILYIHLYNNDRIGMYVKDSIQGQDSFVVREAQTVKHGHDTLARIRGRNEGKGRGSR